MVCNCWRNLFWQKKNLKQLRPDCHVVQYRIVLGNKAATASDINQRPSTGYVLTHIYSDIALTKINQYSKEWTYTGVLCLCQSISLNGSTGYTVMTQWMCAWNFEGFVLIVMCKFIVTGDFFCMWVCAQN